MRNLLFLILILIAGCKGSDPELTPLGKQVNETPLPPQEATYAIAIYIEGLNLEPITLSLNGDTHLTTSQNGVAFFSQQLKLNALFEVTVLGQPSNRNCFILNSVGIINGLNSDIRVKCAPVGSYYIGGPITGLDSGELQVSLGNFETARVQAGSGTYAFSWYVGNGPITLTINNSGTTRNCTFATNQSDSLVVTVANSNINDLQINCKASLSTIVTMSGNISGISGSSLSIIQSNGAPFSLNTNGTYNITGSFFEGQRFTLELKNATDRYCYFNQTQNHLFSLTPVSSKSDIDITCIARTVANECSKGTGELPATDANITSVDCLKNKIIYGGNFTLVGHQKGILKLDTALSTSIAEPNKAFDRIHGKINKIISDNNGGYFVAGLFNRVGDKQKLNLVRLDSRLMIDESFNIETDGEVNDIDLSGSDLFISGEFKNVIINGQFYYRNIIARVSLVSSTPALVNFIFPAASHVKVAGYDLVTEIIGSNIYLSSYWNNPAIGTVLGLLGRRYGRMIYVINKTTGTLVSHYPSTVLEDSRGLFWQDGANQAWYLHPELGMINPITGLAHPSQGEIPYNTSSNFYLDGNDLYIYSVVVGVKTIKKIDLTTLGSATSTLFATVNITTPTSAVFNSTKACFFGADVGGRKSVGCFDKTNGAMLAFNPFPSSQLLTTGVFDGEEIVANAQFATATAASAAVLIDSISRAPILPTFSVPSGVVNSITNDGTNFYVAGSFTNFGGCTLCDSIARISSTTAQVDPNWHKASNAFFPTISSIDISGSSLFISLTSSYSLHQVNVSDLTPIVLSTTPVYFSQVRSLGTDVITKASNGVTYYSNAATGLANWSENLTRSGSKIIKTDSHFYYSNGNSINQVSPLGVSLSSYTLAATPIGLTAINNDKICLLLNLNTVECYSTTSGIFTKEDNLIFNGPTSVTGFNRTGNFLFLSGPNSAPLQIPL